MRGKCNICNEVWFLTHCDLCRHKICTTCALYCKCGILCSECEIFCKCDHNYARLPSELNNVLCK